MYKFMKDRGLCDEKESPYSVATRFEALVALGVHDSKLMDFAKRWYDWVKEQPQQGRPEASSNVTASQVEDAVKILERAGVREDLLSHAKDQAQERIRTTLLGSLDQIGNCKHCDQRRCIIFRCSTQKLCRGCVRECRVILRACYACLHTVNLEDLAEKNGSLPLSLSDLIPVENLVQMMEKGENVVGLPLCCPECKVLCSVVNHCSNNYLCQVDGCSRQYPCKKLTSWMCLICGTVRKLNRKVPLEGSITKPNPRTE
jgi:hypothetical protein